MVTVVCGIGLLQLANEAGGDLVGVGRVAARAAADVEDFGHGFTPKFGVWVAWCLTRHR